MIQINAASRLTANKIKTTNTKFAYSELYVGEGFSKGVKDSGHESFIDGTAVQVRGPGARKAVEVWKRVAKHLCSDFKEHGADHADGTWTDPTSKCKWRVEIAGSDKAANLRLRNLTQSRSEALRYEEVDH